MAAPGAGNLLAQLQGNGGRGVEVFVPPPREDEEEWTLDQLLHEAPAGSAVTTRLKGRDVEMSLKGLARQTETDLVDRGLHSLYLCFGMLHWREVEEADEVRSPLLFVPVSLQRSTPRDPWQIVRAEADFVTNASLQVALREQFGIDLPEADTMADASAAALDDLLDDVRRSVRRAGWTVEPTVVLKRATFHKEAMYRDLIDNIDVIAADSLVRLLADPDAAVDEVNEPELPEEQQVDLVAPPEDARLILDADASQRRAVHAAVEGTSFVMDGPPGSGKSQTIANMIAELISEGRSVLFVSEKAAALDVVYARLKHLGLDDFLFQLHSHKASRKEVAAELGRALSQWPVPRPKLSKVEREQARRAREHLSGYAEAVNETREPLGRSAHWVLGRLANLASVANAPLPRQIDRNLEASHYAWLQELFADLARVWAPIEEGEAFIWRGFAKNVYSDHLRTEVEASLDELLISLETCEDTADSLAFEAGLPPVDRISNAERYASLVAHCRNQPETEAAWWIAVDLENMWARLLELEELAEHHQKDVEHLNDSYGSEWYELGVASHDRLQHAMRSLNSLDPPVPLTGQVDEQLVLTQIHALQDLAESTGDLSGDATRLASALGIDPRPRPIQQLIDLCSVAELSDAAVRPEVRWADPAVLVQAEEAISALTPLVTDYQMRHAKLATTFRDEVFDVDLKSLLERYQSRHRGLAKLSSSYRADKRLLASLTVSGKADKAVVGALSEALALQEVRRKLDAEERRRREVLGRFYRPRDPALEPAASAIATLRKAIAVLGREYNAKAVGAQLGGDRPADDEIGLKATAIHATLTSRVEAVKEALGDVNVGSLTLDSARAWADGARAALADARSVASPLLPKRTSSPTWGDLATDLAALARHQARLELVEAARTRDSVLFGQWYSGLETNWAELRDRLSWTRELQAFFGGPLPKRAVERLHGPDNGVDPDPLTDAASTVRKSIDGFVDRFAPPRDAEVRSELESSFESGRQFAHSARDDADRIRVWLEFTELEEALKSAGLTEATDFCTRNGTSASEVPRILEKAVLAVWLDDVIRHDGRLKGSSASELDGLVEKFRELDRKLVKDAAEQVAAACVALRPKTKVGAAGYIEKEAQKKKKHMPVRTLLEKTSDVVKRLKPCLMMSPLAVSQYLPSNFRFDVAIFDEASQVRPADAINCFYRSNQVIVAGDERQLPPTSFFEVGTLEDDGEYEEGQFDEFESILGQCKGTIGLPALPLRWHYRSQHELLITFSNYRFYEGRLITFPGAEAEAPDLGVAFYRVEGVYRRGGPRDNPVEAAAVADRVIHHMTHHPHLSVGVVAFSQAQADAILDAIDVARLTRPDLDEQFVSDRLDGFFVKALENVQGDERDLMIFSIGYGPDENKKFTLNFGPVNREGGWRRLNVAITRARRRVEVVASFGPEEMDTRGSSNRGVLELQRYLDYAQRGFPALAVEVSDDDRDVESPLEESVLAVVRGWGYDVVPQVGTAGYRVDLGVRDPVRPGRFLLGIECDGAAYHSSKVARDRDRLRQAVLEDLGWRLHRIWGTAWYRDRKREEERLRLALEKARRSSPSARSESAVEAPVKRAVEEALLDGSPDWVSEYEVTRFGSLPTHKAPYDPTARAALRKAVENVLAVEAPIHVDLLAARICKAWGRSATAKVRDAVGGILVQLKRERRCLREGDFVWTSNKFDIRVPGRDEQSRRDVRLIPPEELQEAIHRLLCDARMAADDELLISVARLFGWDRTGAKIHAALDAAIAELENQGWVERGDEGLLRPVEVEA
jgi:very-short-patch-repair endonuclease